MKLLLLSVAVATATIMALATAASASAESAPPPAPVPTANATVRVLKIESLTSTSNVVNYANELGRCYAGSPGIACTISRSSAATNTYALALSATVIWLAAQFNISTATTTSVSISCQSPPLAAGRHFSAFPVGTLRGYRIRQTDYTSNGSLTTLSGPLTSYQANTNAFFCTVG
jgi:hypothetical protein